MRCRLDRLILAVMFRKLNLSAATILLSCISTILLLTSCSKQPSQSAKMEGQSVNWRVTVNAIKKVPKQASGPMINPATRSEGPENRYDTLQVTVNVEYIGAAGNVQSPSVSLINGKGQSTEAAKAVLTDGPGYKFPRSGEPGYDEQIKAVTETLYWIDPESRDYQKKPRALKGGEKFLAIYTFADPKEYTNLNFAFNDVPPILLGVPQNK